MSRTSAHVAAVRHGRPVRERRATTQSGIRLSLLDGFELRLHGREVALTVGAERLLSFLALHSHRLLRTYVAGNLWPDTSDQRAFANLRSCLWRVNRPGIRLVDTANRRLGLTASVLVDYRESASLAQYVLHDETREVPEPHWALLTRVLLPDWYDDWVLLERERHRQLCLVALDSVAQRLAAAQRHAAALDCALSAIALEPLRESAHRTVVEIHLAAGNPSEAIRQYQLFRRVLGERLGLEPSPRMQGLITPLVGDAAVTRE